MNYAKIKPADVANGEGVRVSLFVSGCNHHCKGCFNSELWNYKAGQEFTIETIQDIMELCSKPYITGLSLLGGEPLDPKNLHSVTVLASIFKKRFPHKDLWCYTGYRFEEVKQLPIMKDIDVLVDGQFVEILKSPKLRFRGSSNQRIIDIKRSLTCGCVMLRKDLME
jgi:anaerobic ribonucleoside-triphosphate reductase activating protein